MKWLDWTFVALALLFMSVPTYRWYAAACAYKTLPVTQAVHMLRYAWGSKNRRYLRAAVGVGLFFALFILVGTQLQISFILLILAMILTTIIGLSIPPAVLVLGSSSQEAIHLMQELDKSIYPLRVVSLLDPQFSKWTDRLDISFDNMRTTDQDRWRRVVHPLMDSVLLNVIDVRTASPAVVEECLRILETTERTARSVFVQGENHEQEALDAVRSNHAARATVQRSLGSIRLVVDIKAPYLVRQLVGR